MRMLTHKHWHTMMHVHKSEKLSSRHVHSKNATPIARFGGSHLYLVSILPIFTSFGGVVIFESWYLAVVSLIWIITT